MNVKLSATEIISRRCVADRRRAGRALALDRAVGRSDITESAVTRRVAMLKVSVVLSMSLAVKRDDYRGILIGAYALRLSHRKIVYGDHSRY